VNLWTAQRQRKAHRNTRYSNKKWKKTMISDRNTAKKAAPCGNLTVSYLGLCPEFSRLTVDENNYRFSRISLQNARRRISNRDFRVTSTYANSPDLSVRDGATAGGYWIMSTDVSWPRPAVVSTEVGRSTWKRSDDAAGCRQWELAARQRDRRRRCMWLPHGRNTTDCSVVAQRKLRTRCSALLSSGDAVSEQRTTAVCSPLLRWVVLLMRSDGSGHHYTAHCRAIHSRRSEALV